MRPWPGGSTRSPRSRLRRQPAHWPACGGNCTLASGSERCGRKQAYPHRILRWEDGDGGRGELMRTMRVPYWQLQANADEVYRRELGIP